ncbi:ABC transporter integral membrane protein OS=Tsukamurella paurometabola (strain ATCC 8368 / DSM/ CCUG 35730 / CIP 100753 / JCM 10117 / KCTC 9821 / NBRC 16120 / NCIMB 702349 / NCTC 13040) OX=521096 GN=Tpau_1355 PE=4 SV=1 [Tsukamurella paurometabola]|uniref:ABC transporter integral membrane protein n=1 Tax=Tsukamurella paurometabola (strain ATCC 8368 / DSM 20162 / CCUG 35730 / CIP 100753 / JCM 10117 / KCTC 9821 / NBRC 16120 / NCIMB 702349 / NCTC 13040) TaxID=521096 RepID=D5UWW2_TSUPD|nr:ABC transporter permease [Tsukamurella paurometabola]ADG77984.1 ABC transporter integral membrane protein [Tsukamurella paurometabola DSM 20162]SUP29640.1 ABC-type transport system involved in multi-copper enzyme maturation, permease component [Tsukamurella paurometabola]
MTAQADSVTAHDGAATGYSPGRTLTVRVELARQFRRRRTLVMAALLAALPIVLIVALAVGSDDEGRRGGRPSMFDVATASGLNLTATVLIAGTGFLLVIPVALFFGDAIASEADWSSLRYLLAAPVPRTRLLITKAIVALILSVAAVALLTAVAVIAGTIAYGWGPLQSPTGTSLPAGEALWRLLAAAAFIIGSELATAGLALWLSTRTDAPLAAVGGAVGLTVIGSVLDQVTALGGLRAALPAHWQYAWTDLLQPSIEWAGMAQGLSLSVSIAVIFLALAVRGFRSKDIVS